MLQGCTSGGRGRFLTDSRRLGLRMLVTDSEGYPHMAYSGYAGIDCYLGEGTDPEYLGTRWPPLGERLLESEFELPGTLSLVTLYLPLYTGVELLELGLEPATPPPAPLFFCVKRKGEETAIQRVFPLNWQQVRFANLWGFRPTDTRYVLATLNKRRQPVFVQRSIIIGRSHT